MSTPSVCRLHFVRITHAYHTMNLTTCVTETNWRQCGMLWPKEICFSEHRATNVGLLYPKA